MDNQVNQEVHPAVATVHNVLDIAGRFDRVMQRAGEHKLGMKALAVVAAGGLALSACAGNEGSDETPSTTEATAPAELVVDNTEACPETWEISGVNHGDANKWFEEGQAKIAAAETPDEARDAADTWLNGNGEHPGVKHDKQLLTVVYNKTVKPETPITADELVDENGCSTEKAVQATIELELVLATATITPSEAPVTGYNTGTNAEGEVTVAATAGVGGDRKSIKIVTADGVEYDVMARCGQPVFPGQPTGIPEGPTDETPVKTDRLGQPGDSEQHSIPDDPGDGPTDQPHNDRGYTDNETPPSVPQDPTSTTTVRQGPPATEAPRPTSTLPPVIVTTPPTTSPQTGMPG